ncbi:hypothetical protein QQS21_001609 [Conoideocrella luteorostrata]|uniref:Uncharacterized protein n=1 Tax=Conoideocrella luteorostrata TaxID=1105319 RepID=A0AAJ0G1R5_9HYPO|nr:hypothetical protein QQS21_001609 [Conoideocrella luteorostrata]
MSPTACGRKRSLLRTFGSRRRPKEFAVSPSIQTEEVSPSKPIHQHGDAQRSECQQGYSKSAGELVVNDDGQTCTRTTTNPTPRGIYVAETPSKRPPDCSSDVRRLPLSPFSMHPVLVRPTEKTDKDPRRSVLKRSSLRVHRVGESIPPSRRYTTNSVHLGESMDLLQLLEASTVIDSENNDMLAGKEPLETATQPATDIHQGLVSPSTSSVKAVSVSVSPYIPASPEEVNGKIREMLEAMEALKPSTPSKTMTRSRTLPRVAQSKVFTKMTGALGRIYSKSASPEMRTSEANGEFPGDETGGTPPLIRSSSQANASQYTISSMEIRLNEGKNLNRNKVQQMVRSQVCRKPVNSNGRSILSSQAQQGHVRSGSSSVYQRRSTSSVARGNGDMLQTEDPFDSEQDFEHNLDEGILRASPAGSSTPRIRIHRPSGCTKGRLLTNDLSESSLGQLNIARAVKIDKQDKDGRRVRQVSFRPPADTKDGSAGQWIFHGHVDDLGVAKKHPSPSKRDLEELELAFQRYKLPRGVPCAHDDTDELAASSTGITEVLAEKDLNKRMQKLLGPGSRNDLECKRRPHALTHIPRPRGQVGRVQHAKIRHATVHVPNNANPDDVDELL